MHNAQRVDAVMARHANRGLGMARSMCGKAMAFLQWLKSSPVFNEDTTVFEGTPTFGVFERAFTSIMTDLGLMVKWFGTDAYGVEIRACRESVPELLTTEVWLKNEDPFDLK